MLLEMANHVFSIQPMKRHIFIFSVYSIFITFAVIPFYNVHNWVVFWVVIRSARKLVRYFYHIYLDLGLRHVVNPLEWVCITFLVFTFPLEYFISLVVVLVTFPIARHSSWMQLVLHE